ncbi:rhodanese-like domain-containing protein [Singulisphaera rosea]
MTPAQIQEMLERGEPITFLDDRSPKAWKASEYELPGAIRVPADGVDASLDQIPRDRILIAYGDGPGEESSSQVTQALLAKGWKDVRPLLGGFAAWQEGGYPIEER